MAKYMYIEDYENTEHEDDEPRIYYLRAVDPSDHDDLFELLKYAIEDSGFNVEIHETQ